jgi:TonB family protein
MVSTQMPEGTIRAKAAGWAVGIHILLLLLFMLIRYATPPMVPLEELGMEVNLGTDFDGSGADQPMAVAAPAAETQAQHSRSVASPAEGMQDLERTDDPDAPEIGPAQSTAPKRNTSAIENNRRGREQQRVDQRSQQQRPRYVYSGSSGAGGNNAATEHPGSSEGNTSGQGDRGVPGGTPGAANYEGSPGNGTGGISHSLTGRTISPDRFEAEFREGGKVVVKVTVDREGNIVSATVKSTPNEELGRIALQKIRQARFSRSTSPEPQAFGEVSIIFKARP